jgi:NADH oxidase (H2O2-forming)
MAKRVIVIGSGAAGMKAASAARSAGDAEITVFTEEGHISYSPCAIPFVIEGKIKDFGSIVMHTPEFYSRERSIKVLTKTKVTAVDMDKKTVATADGSVHPYDSLVLSVGGSVFLPPIEGVRLSGVFPVRTIADGMAIKEALHSVSSVVVAGAGVIGLEMAVALKRIGKQVTVVEMFTQVVPRILDADMAKLVQSHCESLGIEFMMGTPMGSIKGEGKVERVAVGTMDIPCQMVIMATGVRANLELPNMMGLEIGPLGAVRVSTTMQPYKKGRLVKDVFLAGDVVQCESAAVTGPTMNQLGSAAVRQGRVAGINAAGGYATMPAVLSPFISVIGDIQAGGTGLSKGLADYYGLNVVEAKAEGSTRARYYPGGKELIVKMLADKETHRIIGAQMVGGEEVTGRINWLTAAIYKGVTAEEFVNAFENAYCPPTSMVKDVVNEAAEKLLKKLTAN